MAFNWAGAGAGAQDALFQAIQQSLLERQAASREQLDQSQLALNKANTDSLVDSRSQSAALRAAQLKALEGQGGIRARILGAGRGKTPAEQWLYDAMQAEAGGIDAAPPGTLYDQKPPDVTGSDAHEADFMALNDPNTPPEERQKIQARIAARRGARKDYMQADDRPPVNVNLRNDRGFTPPEQFRAVQSLRKEANTETRALRTVQQQIALMRSAMKDVLEGRRNAADQGVLVIFQKILDPTSVVRESEYARSGSGQSLLGQLQGEWDKMTAGGAKVTPQNLSQFLQVAEGFSRTYGGFYNDYKKRMDEEASILGVDPKRIMGEWDPTGSGQGVGQGADDDPLGLFTSPSGAR